MLNITGTIEVIDGLTSPGGETEANEVVAARVATARLLDLPTTIARKAGFDQATQTFIAPPSKAVVVCGEYNMSSSPEWHNSISTFLDNAIDGSGQGFLEIAIENTDDKKAASDYWHLSSGQLAGVTKNFSTFQTGEPAFVSVLRAILAGTETAIGQTVTFSDGAASDLITRPKFNIDGLVARVQRIIESDIHKDNGEAKRSLIYKCDDYFGVVKIWFGIANSADSLGSVWDDAVDDTGAPSAQNIIGIKVTEVAETNSGFTGRIDR